MSKLEEWDQPFTALPSRAEGFISDLLTRLPVYRSGERLEVLDLGCGTGAPAIQFASLWADAHVTGLDICQASIEQAERSRRLLACQDRLQFLVQDYMEKALGPFDLIYSDSCLHLISQPNEALFGKLCRELKPGGRLVFSIPRQGAYNRVLSLVRRCFRAIRCKATDYAILKLAQLCHGKSVPVAFFQERVHYMYFIPVRFGTADLEDQLKEQYDFDCEGVFPYPHSSVGQYQHGLWIFKKKRFGEAGRPQAA